MSSATFADGVSSIELTGVEVARIGDLAEQALERALARPRAREVRGAIRWTPGATLLHRRIVEHLADGVMISKTGPWHLADIGANTFAQSHPSAVALTRLYDTDRGWIEGGDRNWLADHYQALLDAGITRPLMAGRYAGALQLGAVTLPSDPREGWEEVIAWLRAGDRPVVTTVSVNERTFPDDRLAAEAGLWAIVEDGEADDERWFNDLSETERWDISLAALRALEATWPRRWCDENFARPALTVDLLIQHAAQVRLVPYP